MLNEKRNVIKSNEAESILEFYHLEMKTLNNTVFMYAYYLDASIGNLNCIQSFSQNLNLRQDKVHFKNIVAMATYKSRLYVLDQIGKNFESLEVSVYDINMNYVQTIGQANVRKPFYFANTIKKLELNERHFFLFHETHIRLMNRHDGLVSKSISVSGEWFLYAEQYMVSFDVAEKTMCSLDMDGRAVSYDKIENLPANTRLIKVANDKFVFFLHEQLYLYLNWSFNLYINGRWDRLLFWYRVLPEKKINGFYKFFIFLFEHILFANY